MQFPRMLPVRQKFPDRSLHDISDTVWRELATSGITPSLRPGARLAIGVGSRGIANLAEIVRSTVDFFKARRFAPFLFPAMGSHGAATAEGQASVLAHYGIDENRMGCPVLSSLEVVRMGRTAEGIEIYFDKNAFSSDAIFLINRIKWHTEFEGAIESGLFKMLAIGTGKLAGAQQYHAFGHRLGMETIIRSVARHILASGKIAGGLAIVEDAHHNTGKIAALRADEMEQREEHLLALAKSWMARIPVPELDLLIVDEIGKPISGSGMDLKVVNRSGWGEANLWKGAPHIERIFVRDLHPESYGNAIGIGAADVVHDRLLAKIDWEATRINVLTAMVPRIAATPIHFPSDRACLEAIAPTTGKLDPAHLTIAWIANTLELASLRLSENLQATLQSNPLAEISGLSQELPFGPDGNLPKLVGYNTEASAPQDQSSSRNRPLPQQA